MLTEEFISTGIEKLDLLLEGGIPGGFTTLLLGTPGSSIEILCKQLASSGNVLFVTTEESQDDIVKNMDRFGWNTNHIEFLDIATTYAHSVLTGEQRRVNVSGQRSTINLRELIELGSSTSPPTKRDSEDFLALLSNHIKVSSSEKILINSLDFFLDQYSPEDVFRTLHAAKLHNIDNKGILFMVMTRGIHGDVFERKMEGLADCVLELQVMQKGSTYERFLAVKKMRNYAKKIGIARYVIDSNGFVLEMIERIM